LQIGWISTGSDEERWSLSHAPKKTAQRKRRWLSAQVERASILSEEARSQQGHSLHVHACYTVFVQVKMDLHELPQTSNEH
jgi:hypothetical protein